MQDTHTPYLKLSHLQVGLYQFELKVQDEVGQSSAATVHVVVKEATGSPPTGIFLLLIHYLPSHNNQAKTFK